MFSEGWLSEENRCTIGTKTRVFEFNNLHTLLYKLIRELGNRLALIYENPYLRAESWNLGAIYGQKKSHDLHRGSIYFVSLCDYSLIAVNAMFSSVFCSSSCAL